MAEMHHNFQDDEEDTLQNKYLTFLINKECFAIEIKYVTEIIEIQPFTVVPELPDYIRGIMNLRGKIIPIMDVRLRFKKPFLEYNDRTCIIVVEMNEIVMGLVVDMVADVLFISDVEIAAPPEISKGHNRYIQGIGNAGGDVKLILDCNKILTDEEVGLLADLLEGER